MYKAFAFAALSAALFLTACCDPKSPSELTDALNRRYRDRPANEFFAEFGLPAGEFELSNQTHVYRWASSRLYLIPPAARLASYSSPEGDAQVVDTYRGATQTHYCELRIFTDAEDNIQRFAIAVDSTGKWSASRCSELFSNP